MDASLFGDDEPAEIALPADDTDVMAADWQISQLRQALDKTGASDMAARQRLVEGLVGRRVQSLRDLTSPEARLLSERMAARSIKIEGGTSWDTREDETWIDRL